MPSLEQLHGPAPVTRSDWQAALRAVVAPATRIAALGPDRQHVHGSNHDPGATWFEQIVRPLWGLAAHAAGGGKAPEQWEQARAALSAALDPEHPWYIGPPADFDQRLVEAAGVGVALALAPGEMWEPLSGRQRQNLARWLAAAHRCTPGDNNWHFFPVLAGLGLERNGIPGHDREITARHLDRIESYAFDTGDGWYSDGPHGNARDYYTAFAIHWYGLLHRTLTGWDTARGERFAERAGAFAGQFQHWFADDGSAVPFGRSQGYRFAQGAFWGALAFADLPALPWGQVRGLAERHLGWWWRHPIAEEDGQLSVGYAYPNSAVVEQYLAGGSPYWSTKHFLPLALAEDHPFWTAAAEPAPAASALPSASGSTSASTSASISVSAQPTPNALLYRDPGGGVVLLNGQTAHRGMRGGAAKYAKFAYSTRAGFSVPLGGSGLADGGFDSVLALSDDDGAHWRGREDVESASVDVGAELLRSRWSPWPDVTVDTWLAPSGPGHAVVHRLVTARPLHSAEGGFSAPWVNRGRRPSTAGAEAGHAWAAGTALDGATVHSELTDLPAGPPEQQVAAGAAGAAGTADVSRADVEAGTADSIGTDVAAGSREARVEHPMAGSNLLFPRTVLPTLTGRHEPGEHWLAAAVLVAASPPSAEQTAKLNAAAVHLLTTARTET